MVCATLLGIFLYPALYYLIGRLGGFEKRQSQNTTQA
jgi:HAE1 family hydrophobic/amphiphilic exporter-1